MSKSPAKTTAPAAPPAAAAPQPPHLPQLHADFEEFVDRLELNHFRGAEFTPYWTQVRGGVQNQCPPETIWHRIVPTLVVLDRIREEIGQPITLTSTYRSPRYNAAVGGEPDSFHMRFMAVDFQADCGALELHQVAKSMRGQLFIMPGNASNFRFAGGIGLYVRSGFVHIDCRTVAGDWKGN